MGNDFRYDIFISYSRKNKESAKEIFEALIQARGSGVQGRRHLCGHIHGYPHAGTDYVQRREPPHRCRKQFANQAKGQQILCWQRQETSPLARLTNV